MKLADEQLQPYSGTLIGFGGEQHEVIGYVTLLTTFGEKEKLICTINRIAYIRVRLPLPHIRGLRLHSKRKK
jgi:hypothetical protein